MTTTLCALSSVARLSVSMTMLLSSSLYKHRHHDDLLPHLLEPNLRKAEENRGLFKGNERKRNLFARSQSSAADMCVLKRNATQGSTLKRKEMHFVKFLRKSFGDSKVESLVEESLVGGSKDDGLVGGSKVDGLVGGSKDDGLVGGLKTDGVVSGLKVDADGMRDGLMGSSEDDDVVANDETKDTSRNVTRVQNSSEKQCNFVVASCMDPSATPLHTSSTPFEANSLSTPESPANMQQPPQQQLPTQLPQQPTQPPQQPTQPPTQQPPQQPTQPPQQQPPQKPTQQSSQPDTKQPLQQQNMQETQKSQKLEHHQHHTLREDETNTKTPLFSHQEPGPEASLPSGEHLRTNKIQAISRAERLAFMQKTTPLTPYEPHSPRHKTPATTATHNHVKPQVTIDSPSSSSSSSPASSPPSLPVPVPLHHHPPPAYDSTNTMS